MRMLRLFVEVQGRPRYLCRFEFQRDDASFYVYPFGMNRTFHYGIQTMGAEHESMTFDWTEQRSSPRAPHLSFHESGQVHCRCGSGAVAGPARITPLLDFRGQHVATLCFDRIDNLAPTSASDIGDTLNRKDHVLKPDTAVTSGRIIVYANGLIDYFQMPPPLKVKMRRPNGTLHLGLGMMPQDPLGEPGHGPGVTIIGGWNVSNPSGDQSLIYLRAT